MQSQSDKGLHSLPFQMHLLVILLGPNPCLMGIMGVNFVVFQAQLCFVTMSRQASLWYWTEGYFFDVLKIATANTTFHVKYLSFFPRH